MATKTKNNKLDIETSLISETVTQTVLSVYGVSALDTNRNDKKGKDDGFTIHRHADRTLAINVYLVLASEVKVTEVLRETQNQLRYILNKKFPGVFRSINVFANRIAVENK